MAQVCTQCARVNPPDAIYCHFDGVILGGRSANGKRGPAGSQPFPSQFVFPSGQACHTFDQLAIACQENWTTAVDLLKKGFLASFLGGIGRADLALAAQEAAGFPDTDRGLDRLLAKFPSRVLAAPKLRIEPTEVSLGIVPFGSNRSFELHLGNLAMRLLYGSVSSDCKWLTLGDAPGQPQKIFQFGSEAVIHVQVRGQHLRAGNKLLEGHLLVESNGGNTTVTVRAEVPPTPYPNGVLAGAITPRQIAEKAHAAPKEAAALFETGAVGRWFAANGWVYPVQGPSASGVGAVQQFFEALGLAKAPKVEINPTAISLHGEVGQGRQATLELKAQERRPVYGHAVCDQPWLDVSRAMLSGRNAVIQVVVPRIPNRPGETLQANVIVTSNGNQKFNVPVSLEIGGEPRMAEAIPVAIVGDESLPVAEVFGVRPAEGRRDFSWGSSEPTLGVDLIMRALPAVLLALLLLAVLSRDIFLTTFATTEEGILVESRPRLGVFFDDDNAKEGRTGSMRFGLVALPWNKQPEKKLTYSKTGLSNSTVVKIGGQARLFGFPVAGESRWVTKAERFTPEDKVGVGTKSTWLFGDKTRPGPSVQISQLVEVALGEPVDTKSGKLKKYLDTCRVRYVLENKGGENAMVGLRVVVDTLIGEDDSNDGVPFTVPGLPGLVNSSANFEMPRQKIPDFLQVLEVPNLKNPGIVGFMNLKLGANVDPPDRVLLTHWPKDLQIWDVPELPFLNDPREPADSAVVLYWNEKMLKAGEKREVGFSYGLGSLSIKDGLLAINVGGSFVPQGDLTVAALVGNPVKGQTVTLKLPDGLRVVEGDLKQQVPLVVGATLQQTPVAWRIRADRIGTYTIEVQSSTGVSQQRRITIKAKTIF